MGGYRSGSGRIGSSIPAALSGARAIGPCVKIVVQASNAVR